MLTVGAATSLGQIYCQQKKKKNKQTQRLTRRTGYKWSNCIYILEKMSLNPEKLIFQFFYPTIDSKNIKFKSKFS